MAEQKRTARRPWNLDQPTEVKGKTRAREKRAEKATKRRAAYANERKATQANEAKTAQVTEKKAAHVAERKAAKPGEKNAAEGGEKKVAQECGKKNPISAEKNMGQMKDKNKSIVDSEVRETSVSCRPTVLVRGLASPSKTVKLQLGRSANQKASRKPAKHPTMAFLALRHIDSTTDDSSPDKDRDRNGNRPEAIPIEASIKSNVNVANATTSSRDSPTNYEVDTVAQESNDSTFRDAPVPATTDYDSRHVSNPARDQIMDHYYTEEVAEIFNVPPLRMETTGPSVRAEIAEATMDAIPNILKIVRKEYRDPVVDMRGRDLEAR